MTTREKLITAINAIDLCLTELDGISRMLNEDFNLEYSYPLGQAVGLLEKCLGYAQEELENFPCDTCNGEGRIDVIDQLRVNSTTIEPPYKSIPCPNCKGKE